MSLGSGLDRQGLTAANDTTRSTLGDYELGTTRGTYIPFSCFVGHARTPNFFNSLDTLYLKLSKQVNVGR